MKLDEAIKHAEEVMSENFEKTKGRKASDPVAINCAECAEEHKQLAEWLKDYKRLLEQEPCKDAISRQTVISVIYDRKSDFKNDFTQGFFVDKIRDLQPVTPQSKMGRWITEDMFDGDVAYRCSECNMLFWIESGTPKDNEYYYCPKCGKRLVEPQESEEEI